MESKSPDSTDPSRSSMLSCAQFDAVVARSTEFVADAASTHIAGPHLKRKLAGVVAFLAELEHMLSKSHICDLRSGPDLFAVKFESGSLGTELMVIDRVRGALGASATEAGMPEAYKET
jgi:hypothetical protein